jgi:hypothetical protein
MGMAAWATFWVTKASREILDRPGKGHLCWSLPIDMDMELVQLGASASASAVPASVGLPHLRYHTPLLTPRFHPTGL